LHKPKAATKKRRTNGRKANGTSAHKFLPISEEMKQWSAMLQSELNSWPAISTKSMFGFSFFYRKGTVFAALPLTRGFDSPSSLLIKFNSIPDALRERALADARMSASMKANSKGWFSFELSSENDVSAALFWLNHAYDAARSRSRRRAIPG
jgi:hypothetical protein